MNDFMHERSAQGALSESDVGMTDDLHGAGTAKTSVSAGQNEHRLEFDETDDASLALVSLRQLPAQSRHSSGITGRRRRRRSAQRVDSGK